MKIKCVHIYNEMTKQYENSHHRLTIGMIYIVFEIEFYLNKVLYRMVCDGLDKSPILQNASQFEIISGKIPSNWEVSQLENNVGFVLGPRTWKNRNFWEECFDGDNNSLEIYKHEARIIMEEDKM
jgi:hypothetical protein